jgi:hypothetical protein
LISGKLKGKYVIEPLEADMDIEYLLVQAAEKIVSSKIFSRISLIFVGGGFGRGEGSVVYKEKSYFPTNDFDIFVVNDSDYDANKKLQLENDLCALTQTAFTDITVMTSKQYQQIFNMKVMSQSDYDLLGGHKILWSDYIKDHNVQVHRDIRIKKNCAINVLLTRVWGLTAPYSVNLEKRLLEPLNREIVPYQIVKSATAIIDAILIFEKRYQSNVYIEKINHFKETIFYKQNKIKNQLILDLVNAKIHNNLNVNEIIAELNYYLKEVVEIYIEASKYVFETKQLKVTRYVFPNKRKLLASFLLSSYKSYVNEKVRQFEVLLLINDYLRKDNVDVNELNKAMAEFYKININ